MNYKQWILSVCGWGDELKSYFDLVIFIYTPKDIRLRRLKDREFQRYGDEILFGGSKYEQSKAFLEWASLYDEAAIEVRSKSLHDRWMSGLVSPILRIEGDSSVKERVNFVLDYLTLFDKSSQLTRTITQYTLEEGCRSHNGSAAFFVDGQFSDTVNFGT